MTFRVVDCVKQPSTTAGLGDFVLGAALAGFLSFPNAYADLECFPYEAHAVDANGARAGEWEAGLGQYHLDGATPKIRRLFKLSGSNVGSPDFVNFAAGTKHISVPLTASQAERLKVGLNAFNQAPTFYVRADGSDGNAGLANTADHAFATLDVALSAVARSFRQANIVVGAGTFGAAATNYADGFCEIGITGAGVGTTIIGGLTANAGASLNISDCSVASLVADGVGAYIFADAIDFPASAGGHIKALRGGTVETGVYSVSGGCSAGAHIVSEVFGHVLCTDEMTLAANVTMANGWVQCARGLGFVEFDGASFALGAFSVTGTRYDVQANSVCNTHGGGASFLPGSTAGSESTGGRYL